MPEPDVTDNYVRYRIREPHLFKDGTFRTLDIGKSGYHKLIRGRLRINNKWKTQSVIVEKQYADLPEVKEETKRIISQEKRE